MQVSMFGRRWEVRALLWHLNFSAFFGQIPNPWNWKYCKIPKISPGLIFFKGPFWGLFLEGLINRENFAFQNCLGVILGGKFASKAYSSKEIYVSN